MSEALAPATGRPVAGAPRRGRRAAGGDRRRGAGGRRAVPGVLRGRDRERPDAGRLRAGGGAVAGVVRGSRLGLRAIAPGALERHGLQLRAGECGRGDASAGPLPAGDAGLAAASPEGRKRHDVPAHHRAAEALEAYLAAGGGQDAKAPLFQSVDREGRLSGRPLGRRAVLAMIDQAAGGGGTAGVDVLPHVSGDGHHGVPVERRDARARATDRRPLVAENDDARRPDVGHDLARRDRTHRDLDETRRAGPVKGRRPCRLRAPRR